MRIRESLQALEKTVEQQMLSFFILLGAGEAPESWLTGYRPANVSVESPGASPGEGRH